MKKIITLAFVAFSFSMMGQNTFPSSGNVGIGTNSPNEKLEVKGVIRISNNSNSWRFVSNSDGSFSVKQTGFSGALNIFKSGSANINLLNLSNGKVGIGTTNPDSKLTVNGTIHSKEVLVDLNIPADYVFQKYYTGFSSLKETYQMPTLEEVEAFTKENHHLPNIPSASTIQKEGMQLSEMTNLLLQKIEELTLYTIEQEKRIKALEGKLATEK